MPLITENSPDTWRQLEELVTAIFNECGMTARQNVSLALPRGSVDVDVYAEETIDGINHLTICECKNWQTNIPRAVVHAFRTVMQETGANRGYIISKVGFQVGAFEAVKATNIELVTFAEFQEKYFDKWINKRIWALENEIGSINTYYEPTGTPGYNKLESDQERADYDAILEKYMFVTLLLVQFSPYTRRARPRPFPDMPFDVSKYEARGIKVPNDIKAAMAYREFLEILSGYAAEGLRELRAINPITR